MSPDTSETEEESDRHTDPLPTRLQSSRTKLVYLYLRAVAGARVEDLENSLGMGPLTLFPVLDVLIDYGLVERIDDRYVATTEDGR
jgi:Mn-dependent DtxR family transcriptional regulator